jgi:arsenite methyltransferase
MAQYQRQEITALETLHLYDELPFWSAPFGLALLDAVRIRSALQVLDLGAGYGFPMLELAERLDGSSKVTGIDPSEACNRVVNNKIADRGIINASIIRAVAEELPFGNDQFDLIVSNNGLNNVQDLHVAVRESFRVLKPGGQMVFTVNLPHTFTEFYEIFEEFLLEKGMNAERDRMLAHISEKRKPPEYFRDLLLETGFDIVSMQPEGFKYRFADGTTFFRHFTIRNFFMPPWQAILPADKVESIFAALEQRLNHKASQTGFLEMSVPFIIFDLSKSRI